MFKFCQNIPFKKYDGHVIVYKDYLEQTKNCQRDAHIIAYENVKRSEIVKENMRKREEEYRNKFSLDPNDMVVFLGLHGMMEHVRRI